MKLFSLTLETLLTSNNVGASSENFKQNGNFSEDFTILISPIKESSLNMKNKSRQYNLKKQFLI
jgi:hypothetical protein